AQLNKPKPRVIAAYESYLNGTSLGGTKDNPKSIIFGSGGRFLQDPTDLVALQKPSEEDSLSRFLQKHWLFRKRDSTDVLDGTTLYKNSHIIRTVAVIDLVLASILLIGAVVSLYYVSSPRAKLALVAVYTLL
nr:hypothetical protein [Tanacetum cinerariifolium]